MVSITAAAWDLINLRTELSLDCTLALLEERVAILICLQKDVMHLAEGLEAQVIPLLLGRGSLILVSEEADVPAASLQPASFYTDMCKLVESLVKNSTALVHQGYQKLQFYSRWMPTPGGEEEFESWMDQAIQAVEEWSVPEVVKRRRIS